MSKSTVALSEFGIIRKFFADLDLGSAQVLQGVGDDCALLASPEPGYQLAMSTDTLLAGVHFPGDSAPDAVAKRALAVNLSDLNAMGAEPFAFTLAITLPSADAHWLQQFAQGLRQQAEIYNIPLVGGDTTRGPLAVTVNIIGQVPQGLALLRSGASPGDAVYVSGTLGDAAAALHVLQHGGTNPADAEYLLRRFYAPEVDFALGGALRGIASAAIDISDGLLADLGHILRASRVGAVIHVDAVPRSAELLRVASRQQALDWALSGGDDYRLCFTVPAGHADRFRQRGLQCTRIGEIVAGERLQCLTASGEPYQIDSSGYQHF